MLSYRPPFAWGSILRFLETRAITGVEAVVDGAYLRTVSLGKHRGWLKVEPVAGRDSLAVELPVSLMALALPQVLAKLRRLFDLDARPT